MINNKYLFMWVHNAQNDLNSVYLLEHIALHRYSIYDW